MEAHDDSKEDDTVVGNGDGEVEAMSPESSSKLKLQLPISVDPPSASNPAKQLVWIVSTTSTTQRL